MLRAGTPAGPSPSVARFRARRVRSRAVGLVFLGPFEVNGPVGPVSFRGAKDRLLLALLAVRANEVVATSRLIDDLWAEDLPEKAGVALRAHVAHLRKALGAAGFDEIVVTRKPGYMLRADPSTIDAVQFERGVAEARGALAAGDAARARRLFTAALARWHGDAFADCRDAETLRAEAVRLDQLRLVTIEDRIELDLAFGDHAALAAEVEALLVQYPFRERLWHAFALALYRAGRPHDALAAQRRAIETLAAVGIEPGGDLRRLEIAILDRDPSLDLVLPLRRRRAEERRSGSRLLAAVTSAGPQFVGRDDEYATVIGAWKRARDGAFETVLLAGEPGIGKTRLAAEVAIAAQDDGAYVLHGRCDEGLGVPYQPFVEALRDHLEAVGPDVGDSLGGYASELVRLVPELADRLPDLPSPMQSDPSTEQYRLFDAVSAWLQAVSREGPVILVVDDLHWAAPPTVLLLRHLICSERALHVLVIGTYRDSELGDAPALAGVLADLRRASGVQRLPLRGLDEAAVVAFVEAAAGHDLDAAGADFARAVHEQTGGNPFFVNEIVRNLAEVTGAPNALTGASSIPAAAREVVMRRVERLPSDARQVLSLGAVIGMEFEVDVLQHVLVDLPTDALLGALERATAARLIDELGPNRFGFAHAITRDALTDSMTASRLQWLHHQVGIAIETVHAAQLGEHSSELVRHFADAAPRKAVPYAIAAARAALETLAFEDAINLARRGIAAAEQARLRGSAVTATEACDLCLVLGQAELRAGFPAGRGTLLRAYDIARTIGDARRQAHAALAVNRGYFARIGQTDDELIASLEDAIAAQPPGDTAELAELRAALASELVWSDDGERRFALSADAIDTARRVGDPRTLARVLLRAIMTIIAPDTLATRRAHYEELVVIADELHDPAIQFDAAFAHSTTAWESGDVEASNEMQEIATALAQELRQPRLVWQASFMRTSRLIEEGKLDEAETLATATLDLGERAGQGGEAFIFYTEQLLEIRRWQDRLPEVVEMFGDLAGRDDIDFGYSLIRYLYDAGEHAAAGARYREVLRRVVLPPRRDMLALATLYNLGYLAARLGDREHAPALYEALAPYAGSFTNTTVAKPVAHHALGMLAATMGDAARAVEHLECATRVHERVQAPLLLDETRVEHARLLLATGASRAVVDGVVEAVRLGAARRGARFLLRACDGLEMG